MKVNYFWLALLCTMLVSPLSAQYKAKFDGQDDYALVKHHADFNFGTKTFTIEANVSNLSTGQDNYIYSKHDGKFGLEFGIDSHGVPFVIINNQTYYPEGVDEYSFETCTHVAVVRDGNSDIYFYLDGQSHWAANDVGNVDVRTDLFIGKNYNATQHLHGYLDELRVWSIARSDAEINEYKETCLPLAQEYLVAYWNIESPGHIFNDVTLNGHNARLGDTYYSDSKDPDFHEEGCLNQCCSAEASFTMSTSTPKAAQTVVFTNTSTNASSIEWFIDGVSYGSSNTINVAFPAGSFTIQIVAFDEDCRSMKAILLEVLDEPFQYCGEETSESQAVQELKAFEALEPNGNDLFSIKIYDRFGNRYLPNEITPPVQLKSSSSPSCTCGIFELTFLDVANNRDYGFDDPSVLGGITLGEARRNVACRVFEDLSVLMNPGSSLPNSHVRIEVRESEGKGPTELVAVNELSPGVLAVAGPYIVPGYSSGIADGLAYKSIVSGTDATQNTPGIMPGSFHGHFRVDFELPNFFLNHANWSALASANESDLYTTLLHEAFHILGFYSLIDAQSNLSKISGSQLYNRFDYALENSSGTPYIDPVTGILNPASNFVGAASCAADVTYNGVNNSGQSVYLPAPWNSSILSHVNCNASNANACAVNNGFMMNACIAPGEMQRAPNPAEYSTLCDLGYSLSTTYGNAAVGTPANNVPYQSYTACTPACAVAAVDDNLTATISVAAGQAVTINTSDFIPNDNNPNNSYDLNSLISDFGTFSNVTTTSFDFTPNSAFAGTAIIQYTPTCSNGSTGASALIFISVTPIVIPCNIPPGACNILCNGDLEQVVYNNGNGAENNIDNFSSYYRVPSTTLAHRNSGTNSDLYEFDNTGVLLSINPGSHGVFDAMDNCESGYNHIPLPVDFASGQRQYMGIGLWSGQYGEHITLSLSEALVPAATPNYRLGFWAFSTCQDIDVRMVLSEEPPCPGIGSSSDPWSDVYDPVSGYLPGSPAWATTFMNHCTNYVAGSNQGLTITNPTWDNGTGVVNPDGWEYFTLDFNVNSANLDEVIFHLASNNNDNFSKYVFIDNISIEKLVPNLTITQTVIGTPCPGNKVVIEYNVCSDIPVSGVDLFAQIALGSNLTYTNALDFTNGQLTGLDLGVNGNPLCTTVQCEVEIPSNSVVPSTQTVELQATGGAACTTTGSNLTTNINVIQGTNLTMSITPSAAGPFNINDNFTVDVTITNTGSNDAQNVVVDLPSSPATLGFSNSYTATNIGTITAGNSHTITGIPITVVGPCGDAQVCAEVVSADGVCNLPSGCTPLATINGGTSSLAFPVEIEGANTNGVDWPTSMTIANDGSIYVAGLFNEDIAFKYGGNTTTLAHNASCISIFVAKYNGCGVEWAREVPACVLPSLFNRPQIEVNANNEAHLGFSFENSFTMTVGGTPTTYTSSGGFDLGLMKFDVLGNAVWFHQDGGIENEVFTDLGVFNSSPTNKVAITGFILELSPFSGSNIAPTGNSSSIGGSSFPYHSGTGGDSWAVATGTAFVANYEETLSASLIPLWVDFIDQPINPINVSSPSLVPIKTYDLDIDNSGNIYMLGAAFEDFTFTNKNTSSANGTPGLLSLMNNDVDNVLVSYTQSGTERWAGFYGSDKYDLYSSLGFDLETPNLGGVLEIDNFGNCYIGIQMVRSYFDCSQSLPSVNDLENFGVNLTKVNTLNGAAVWSRALAEPVCRIHDYTRMHFLGDALIGNHTFHPNITTNANGDVFVSANFMLEDPDPDIDDEFSSIDFYSTSGGQIVNHSSMNSFGQVISGQTAFKHTGVVVEKFNGNGAFQWVAVNNSIIPDALFNGDVFAPSELVCNSNGDLYYSFGLTGEIDFSGTTYYGTGSNGDGYIYRIQDNGTSGVFARPVASNSNTTAQLQNDLGVLSTEGEQPNTATAFTAVIQPNPNAGQYTLSLQNSHEQLSVSSIQVMDITGRVVKTVLNSESSETQYEIDMSGAAAGTYFVRILANEQVHTERVVLIK